MRFGSWGVARLAGACDHAAGTGTGLEALFRIVGASEARIEWARGVLGEQLRAELEALIERAALATVTLPGYE